MDQGNRCLPVASAAARVDLAAPAFSNPTSVTNRLHPSSVVDQVIYGGQVDDLPFRTEFTRLPTIKSIRWNGQDIAAITYQYLSYKNGRIEEIALDWFAQADDGSVWYLGEDISDYKNGAVYTHEGTWLAGRDGPGAMIMPAHPEVSNVYRTENAPGIVFEEITVKAVDQTIRGPYGLIAGAMTVSELHTDGTTEDKVFAPGYGEFSTGSVNGDLEAVSLAVPTDSAFGPLPPKLAALSAAIRSADVAAGADDWAAAGGATDLVRERWLAYRKGGVPSVLDRQMTRDVESLAQAVRAHAAVRAHQAALRVAQNESDLRLRYRPVVEVDRLRLRLWARQLRIDLADKQTGAVSGDVATLGLVRDRLRHTLPLADAGRLDAALRDLRTAADAQDLGAVSRAAAALEGTAVIRSAG